MFVVPEDVNAYYKNNLDNLFKFAETAIDAGERLFDLQVQSAKAASAEAIDQIKALAAAKDVQELASLQSAFSQANVDKATGYSRAVYAWASETQAQVSKLVDNRISDLNKTVSASLDKAAKSAPTGSEFAFVAIKTAVSAANQAYDALSRAGKQAAEVTEATVQAAAPVNRKKAA